MDFPRASARYLRDVYLPRLERALAELPEKDLWWRPHARATSAGNLLLHLDGNLRQWVLAGLGGEPDRRRRAGEFAAKEGAGTAELRERIAETVRRAAAVIERQADLDRPLTIQGFATTPGEAVYHVVEHFSWHLGQIVWIAKLRAGEGHGIAFYDDAKLG